MDDGIIVMDPPAKPHGISLIEQAIAAGRSAEEIKSLTELAILLQDREAEQAFNRDMAACQAEMQAVVRDTINTSTGKKYAPLETIHAKIKPVYTKHGFSISWGKAERVDANLRMEADVMHRGGHTKHRQFDIGLDGIGPKGNPSAMNAPQISGSTMSYGRRYGEILIFDLTITGEDNDAQNPDATANPEQLEEIERLIAESGADLARFLGWLKIEKIDDLPAKRFHECRDWLNRKIKAAKKKEGGI